MSEELKSNENVGALQPDALAQIASVDPSPAVGGMHPFTPAMLSRLKKQRQLLSELEHALKNHEFCFFLQPKCNSMTRAIVGMEALVRWNHPTRGCVPPSEFMPLLESTGLVTQLDQYIWESVCKTLHKWQESGSNLVPVSVNVSVVDIVNLDVPQIFSNLVEKYQLEPKLLLAEITETMLAENASLVENTIQGLHRKGFSVMMDDFGSGYSSLNMLKDTNVDAIKLDMKLIDMNQQNRSKGVQIVESVVDMAHRLNLPIIAEGVETPEQVSMLQAADCLYTQGYYFYKPMPVENAEALLAQPNSEDYWDMRRANAARKFFVSSRIYRIGGDEFVILTPNQPPYSVWVAVDKMRAFLRAKEYEISVGIQSTNDLHRLDDAMNQAEAAMRQDKQAYYARNGQERQLRGLNEKLEQTLTEKRDAEHFLRVLAPKYKSVFVVDLKTDRMRGVIVPDYFQKILDTSGGSFLAVLQQYRDTQVQPAYRESLADLLDYNYIRSKVLTGDIVEHTYKKTDDTTFRVKVTPYSRSGSHIDETLWIFSDEGASLTPPQTK